MVCRRCCFFFFFKQKTAYEMRISDWSSDVCSSDLSPNFQTDLLSCKLSSAQSEELRCRHLRLPGTAWTRSSTATSGKLWRNCLPVSRCRVPSAASSSGRRFCDGLNVEGWVSRSEEHTSELQSLMRSSYAVFCLKKKK